MAQMTSTGVEDRRDPLYRKKHAGVPGNGGQTAEHERTETGKSVINASIDTLDADDTAKRAFAEAAMRATSPLDLIDRRVEAVETYIADKYNGDVKSVSIVSDGNRLMVMSATNADETIADPEMQQAIEDDLNDVVPTGAMSIFSEGMTVVAGGPAEDKFDRYPAIGEETLAEYTNRIVADWTAGEHPDNIPEVEMAAREFAYETYKDELNEHALTGGEVTDTMLDGLNEPNRRYFEQHYKVDRTVVPGVTRPIESFSELADKPVSDHYDHEKREASRKWLIHDEDGKKVYAEVSVHHAKSRPGYQGHTLTPGIVSSFRVYTEEPTGPGSAFVTRKYDPMSDAVNMGFDETGRWNRKHLVPALERTTERLQQHFENPQIREIMSRAHQKAEAIVFDTSDD